MENFLEILGSKVPFLTPFWDIFLIAFVLSIITSFIHKFTTDQKKLKEIKEKRKDIMKRQKELIMKKASQKEMKKIQDESKDLSLEQMKMGFNFKMILFTLPLFFVFFFIRENYSSFGIILNIGFIKFKWLGTYIFFSIFFSIFVKKIFKIY